MISVCVYESAPCHPWARPDRGRHSRQWDPACHSFLGSHRCLGCRCRRCSLHSALFQWPAPHSRSTSVVWTLPHTLCFMPWVPVPPLYPAQRSASVACHTHALYDIGVAFSAQWCSLHCTLSTSAPPLEPAASARLLAPSASAPLHHGVEMRANLKSISHTCHHFDVASVRELTKETIDLPLGSLQGGC